MLFKPLFSLTSVAVLAPLAVLAQNAFEGAVGFGAVATGGNDGEKVHVTNLKDSGEGSFRDAVSHSNRYIVFDVSGYVELESAVSLSSHLTIDGTTAPGDGIGFMAAELSASKKDNIIVRNIRMRQGTKDRQSGKSAFNMGHASNVILDHVSVEYGQWNDIDGVGVQNLTISNSIIALPIGQQFGAHIEGNQATYYRNLWADGHNRQPLSKANSQYLNNVIYNYQAGYTAHTSGKFTHDIINNYFITGPSTSKASNAFYQVPKGQKVYAAGNYLDQNKDGSLNGKSYNSVDSATMIDSPWAADSEELASLSAAEAVETVLAESGAFPRDEVDDFVVAQVKTYGKEGKIYKSEGSTGLSNEGYGTLN